MNITTPYTQDQMTNFQTLASPYADRFLTQIREESRDGRGVSRQATDLMSSTSTIWLFPKQSA